MCIYVHDTGWESRRISCLLAEQLKPLMASLPKDVGAKGGAGLSSGFPPICRSFRSMAIRAVSVLPGAFPIPAGVADPCLSDSQDVPLIAAHPWTSAPRIQPQSPRPSSGRKFLLSCDGVREVVRIGHIKRACGMKAAVNLNHDTKHGS